MALEYTLVQRLEAKLLQLAREREWLEAELKRAEVEDRESQAITKDDVGTVEDILNRFGL